MARGLESINNLNTLEDNELEEQQQQREAEQLRMFSNTQFYDLDVGQSTDIGCTVDELLMQQEKEIHFAGKPQPGSSHDDHARLFEFDELQQFSLAGDIASYQFEREETTPAALHTAHRQNWYKQHQHQHQLAFSAPVATQRPPQPPQPEQIDPLVGVADALPTPVTPATPSPAQQHSHNEALSSRQVAEEDKRRRNTAASARFRIKKKLKEQELERNTKQMQSRIDDLESKIRQLEMENKWLKNLVVQKNDARDSTNLEKLRADLLAKRE